MSSLLSFDEIERLPARDLRVLLTSVSPSLAAAALASLPQARRARFLGRLPEALGQQIEDEIAAFPTVPDEWSRAAQLSLLDRLSQLARAGRVAFDDPADMVA